MDGSDQIKSSTHSYIMKKTLFDISEDMLAIRDLMDNFDGEVSDPEVEELIDRLFEAAKENEDELDRKLDSYIWLIKELKGDAKTQKEEADRLHDLSKRNKEHATKLEARLEYIFKRLGFKERKTKYHTLKLGFAGGVNKLEVDLTGYTLEENGEGKPVPEHYIIRKAEINNAAIREDLENGVDVGFAYLKDKEEKLKIK